MSTQDAMKTLITALKADPEYRKTWQANLAMEFVQAHEFNAGKHDTHYIANEGANNFLNNLTEDIKEMTIVTETPE